MKRTFFYLTVAAGILVSACGSGTGNGDSVDSANAMNDQNDTTGIMNNDSTSGMPVNGDAADFAVKMANGGMAEVELGKLAKEKASSQAVKDFGSMMVTDHSKANDELKSIAASKNIALPADLSDKFKQDMEDLRSKSGKDFDKAYMDMMVKDHKDDVDELDDASKNLPDSALKNFAMQTLPIVQGHLDKAKSIQDKLK